MGHMMQVFRRAVSLLRELNALDASTRRTASTTSSSNWLLIASIPASHALSCPAQSCKHPPLVGCHVALPEGLPLILAISASHQSLLVSLLDICRGLWDNKQLGQIFPLGQRSWSTTSWLVWQWHYTGPPRFPGRKSTFSSNQLHWDQKVRQSHPFAGQWIRSLGHLSDQTYLVGFGSREALTNRWGPCWLPRWMFVLEMFYGSTVQLKVV